MELYQFTVGQIETHYAVSAKDDEIGIRRLKFYKKNNNECDY